MAKQIFSMDFYGKKIQVEVGEMAKQANGSCLVRYDDTVVLSTACAGKEPKDVDFFPLTVTYEEKLYSVGKIPGGFLKREGRPSEHGTLTARMIDRPIRPLFADGFRNEVQVVNTVLSVDQEATPEMAAMLGASIALCISDIPFNGPIAGVNVGLIDGEFTVNAGPEDMARSEINLEVAGTKDAINMVEADAKEVDEETMLNALMFGHEKIKELIAFQEQIVEAVGKEKIDVPLFALDENIVSSVEAMAKEEMIKAISIPGKLERYAAIDELDAKVVESFEEKEYATVEEHDKTIKQVKMVLGDLEKEEVRRLITEEKVRPDGRKVDEVRPLDAQVDLLPRVHGSAMFTRGETQVLSACTLGALGEVQKIDGLGMEDQKRFMHHYNFPPYCVGETGRMGSPGRREIGHGALGERALRQVIPSEAEFPYTIRVVAEVLESNGSSSQASICASTMALMAAGVPISNPVAGVAMGLVKKGENYTILTDIQGMEDHLGDMDFKVAGTKNGICALQMDIKIDGITKEILQEALAQAKVARGQIMDCMMSAISEPRDHLSPYAPKVAMMKIEPEQIKDVIGKGGDMINKIIAESDNVKIDIDDEGNVTIYHYSQEAIDHAMGMIKDLTRKVEVGEIFDGKAVRVEEKYAFIELFPGTNGFLHVKDVAWDRTNKVSDVIKLGDTVKVKVTQITDKGVNVSRKALLPKPIVKHEAPAEEKK
ncbi:MULTISPECIES: polyribonucleotide nucleotidyltransferase [Catenibacterium]|uniref:Polyribonucleotide nucleotidyltransferase n=1 Tax=Catenibacterium mitsuokai TaxID=100886 RepID=A0AAW4MPK5_9FIRM|nr:MULTISPECIES: polyribonucleotide nucleotidyltransferase [Catenibacterium]MBV3365856.1 polyribonucleotide nucleotidyltransferase [Catenibacterium mitsuokai]MBV3369949.1 polyribonucleotide nucleotidyltransferase [Catenibacterium mitsuokai]MBV3375242.1 polyribonucleotide nucleotidyltransferase [Catenibacterium mitsuokai]MBV3377492.1 polyribonucleotide nucleotidyltransferase [Catenibacterium mitsuokai]MBV3379787.1 polyribonucleotide nucleotidyltransferase [Catenibacterium mitsuokai]